MKKLTLITITFCGRSVSRLISAEVINNRIRVSKKFLDDLAAELGCAEGQTYTIE
jgi:hypothetical protein